MDQYTKNFVSTLSSATFLQDLNKYHSSVNLTVELQYNDVLATQRSSTC